jgi:hypothetical protein
LSWHLADWIAAVQLPMLARAALAAAPAALLIAAACEVFATGGRGREALASGLRSAWPGLLPLALLPLVAWLPADIQTAASAVIFVAAALVLTAIACTRPVPAARAGLLLVRGDDRRIGVWQLALLAVALLTTVLYLVIGARVTDISDNDGAYYYGVAQHMVRTGRFEEPIVWHFLNRPEQIVHAPFDYWGGLTSLLLLPGLALFGTSPQPAFLTMSIISAASVIACWYLVCLAPLLRYRFAQLVALLVFAFSPGLVCFRFQPESTAVAHLFILLALVAFQRRHFGLAVVTGFCILLARGDGLILFVLIALASVVEAARHGSGALRVALVGLGCLATYAAWSTASFGTVTPPAPRILPFLERYAQVFDYGALPQPSLARLLEWFGWDYLVARIGLGLDALRMTPFTPATDLWLAIALLPGITLLRRRSASALAALIWVLCFAGYFAVVWAAGSGFNPWRAPYTFTPLVVLAGALGLDTTLGLLQRWVERGRQLRPRALLAGAAIGVLGSIFLDGVKVYDFACAAATRPLRRDVAPLDDIVAGQPIASNAPWYMIAYTSSPAVSIPYNGEPAIADVFERYRPRWLVLVGNPPLWVEGASRGVLRDVLAGKKTNLGRFQLERVDAASPAAVYRIESEPSR